MPGEPVPHQQKIVRSGGMPPLKWMHSVRAIRDTPVRDHSVPDINKMRPGVYCAPIAVSLFFRVQLVTYFK